MKLKDRIVGGLLPAVAALIFAGQAQASAYTGTLQKVQTEASPVTQGNTRVSIYTGGATSCGTSGWYAFDMPSASVGSAWTAAVLAAITANIPVTITGTGTCDAFGVEGVSNMISLP